MSDRTQATPAGYVPPDDSADPLPPGLVDGKRYTLVRKLGGGGMGVVYLLRNVRMGRPEVVKLIRPDRSASAEAVDRFRREIAAIGQLNHPHVAVGYGTDEIDGTLLLILEYVDGTDLSELVKANGPLPVGRACEYVRQAALGLQHAHDRGLVHRDVKPANLLVRREREQEWVKVIDFGLVRGAGGADDSRPLTLAAQSLGTPAYMAPEQARAAATAGPPADVYALGGTLYFLLTGRPPFDHRKSAVAVMLAHGTEPPPPVPGLPPGLAAVLDRMLAKNPADRPPSAAEVAALLAPFTGIPDRLGGGPPSPAGSGTTVTHDPRGTDTTLAPPAVTPANQPRRLPWRRPAVVGLAAVGGLAAVWVAVAAVGGKPSDPAAPTAASTETPLASFPDRPPEAVVAKPPPTDPERPAATAPTKPADPPKPKPVRPVASEFGRNDPDGWQTCAALGGGKDLTGPVRLERSGPDWWVAATRGPMRPPFFWAAPDKFRGDQSDKFGRWLAFKVRASQPVSPKEILDAQYVTLRQGAGAKAVVLFVLGRDLKPAALAGGWRGYAVRLDRSGLWRVKADRGPGRFDGPPATDDQIRSVLRDLSALVIRGEYAEDKEGALDSVTLGAADRPKW